MPFCKKKQGGKPKGGSTIARKRKGKQKGKQHVTKKDASNDTPLPPPAISGLTPDLPTNARRRNELTISHRDNQHSTEAEVDAFLKEEIRESLIDTSINTRHAIIYKFRTTYAEAPDTDATPWGGKGGIISKIKNDLDIPRGTDSSMIRNTLDEYLMAKQGGFQWKPFIDKSSCGKKPTIDTESHEAQIIGDALESGLSCTMAWNLVNIHRQEENLPSVTLGAVYTCIKRLLPKVAMIHATKQGSNNPEDNMCKARFAWSLQLGIRLGEIKTDEVRRILLKKGVIQNIDDELPMQYDISKLSKLSLDQFATWDETHKKIIPGSGNNGTMDRVYKFPRDENGKIDLKNGVYSNREVSHRKCKYTDEVRLCLGVAVVTPLDENGLELPKEGRRLRPFAYSTKVLLSITDYEKKIDAEIQRVKNLKCGYPTWIVVPPETAHKVYRNDSITHLKDCGKKTSEKLNEHGIYLVSDLCKPDIDPEHLSRMTNISITRMNHFISQSLDSPIINRPDVIDHRKAPNPYLSKFGPDWKDHIMKSSMLRGYRCISQLIEHMVIETKRAFKGTTHEHDCMFYHDALSLMTAKRTRQWMKDKGYDKMWILPENKLYHDDDALKAYRGRPAGNSPELCNLDSNLNRDVHVMVKQLVDQTASLHNNDPDKYLFSTPKKGEETYLRVFDPQYGCCPSSSRIIQDTNGVAVSIRRIVDAEGCVVGDINNRAGKRRIGLGGKSGLNSSRWGGARKRKQSRSFYGKATPSAKMVKKSQVMKLEVSKRIFNGVKPEGATGKQKQGNEKKTSWQVILQHQNELAEEYLGKTEYKNSGNVKKAILDKYKIDQKRKQKLKK